MLYPIIRNNLYGFINETGQIIIEPKYKYIGGFSNQVCRVSKELEEIHFEMDGKVYFYTENSIIDTGGKLLFPFKKYLSIGEFSDDLAFCYNPKTRKHGVINKNGEEVIPFIFSTSEIEYSLFSNGLARVKRDNKYGFINKKNEIIIPFIFDKVSHFHDGFAVVKIKSKEALVNTNGDIFKSKYKIVSTFNENRAIVRLKKKYGFINQSNELVIDFLYDKVVGDFTNGFCLVKNDNKYGLINKLGETIIDFKFEQVRWIGNGVFPARIGSKWTLIDLKGNIKFEPKFDYIDDFNKFQHDIDYSNAKLTRAVLDKKDYYIDTNGNLIEEIETLDKEIIYSELQVLLNKKPEQKHVWDKAEWSYDGFSIIKKGAIKPFYFLLNWFKKNDLLTDDGIEAYNDKNNLEIGLYRFMFKEDAAIFLDYFYDYWYEKQHIANYQIDPNLKFEENENLEKYWEFYKTNHNR